MITKRRKSADPPLRAMYAVVEEHINSHLVFHVTKKHVNQIIVKIIVMVEIRITI